MMVQIERRNLLSGLGGLAAAAQQMVLLRRGGWQVLLFLRPPELVKALQETPDTWKAALRPWKRAAAANGDTAVDRDRTAAFVREQQPAMGLPCCNNNIVKLWNLNLVAAHTEDDEVSRLEGQC
jgi:hypothetical protein